MLFNNKIWFNEFLLYDSIDNKTLSNLEELKYNLNTLLLV